MSLYNDTIITIFKLNLPNLSSPFLIKAHTPAGSARPGTALSQHLFILIDRVGASQLLPAHACVRAGMHTQTHTKQMAYVHTHTQTHTHIHTHTHTHTHTHVSGCQQPLWKGEVLLEQSASCKCVCVCARARARWHW